MDPCEDARDSRRLRLLWYGRRRQVWVLGADKSHCSGGPCWQQHTAGRASKLEEHTPTIPTYLTQSSWDTRIGVGISPGIPRTYPETEKHHHHTLYTGANNASANGHPTPISIYYNLRQRQIRLVCLKWPKHPSLVAQCITSAHYENRSITTIIRSTLDNMGSSRPRDHIKTKLAAIDAEEMPFMTDETFENLLTALHARFPQQDHKADFTKLQTQLTRVDHQVDSENLRVYMTKQSANERFKALDKEDHGKGQEELQKVRHQYALQQFIASLQPPDNIDFDKLRTQYGFTEDFKLYLSDRVQPLKLYQVAGKSPFKPACPNCPPTGLFEPRTGRSSAQPLAPSHIYRPLKSSPRGRTMPDTPNMGVRSVAAGDRYIYTTSIYYMAVSGGNRIMTKVNSSSFRQKARG